MMLHGYRRVLGLATLVGLSTLVGCGDPCLDDGRGEGQCNAQDGSGSADSTTDTGDAGSDDDPGTDTGSTSGDDCTNGMTDPGETDVDCGGVCVDGDEGKCDEGDLCEVDNDCIGGLCESGTCGPDEPPDPCTNGMADAAETDVDCGGACVEDAGDPNNPAGKCDEGDLCELDGDCVSDLCDMGVCTGALGPCENMMTDPGETDADCGGTCVEDPNDPDNDNGKCDEGEGCLINSDCASELCEDGTCVPPDPCGDGQQNNGETDVDCGGGCVADPNDPDNDEGKCGDGQGCLIIGDCINDVCEMDVCVGPCSDGVLGMGETDVDCGDTCVIDPNDPDNPVGKCDLGEICVIDSDCVTHSCDNGVCTDPCANDLLDMGETDEDCGGICVIDPNDEDNPDGKCVPGELCVVDSDCKSHSCNINGLCNPGPCENLMLDLGETDFDCGDTCVEDPNDPDNPEGKCNNGQACVIDGDCISNMCINDVCEDGGMCIPDMMQNGNETDEDCGGDCVNVPDPMNGPNGIEGQCGEGEGCLIDNDCVQGSCEDEICDTCVTEDSNSCQACLQENCCDKLIASCWDDPKCVCWFNCIQHNNDFQPCFDSCGSGGVGAVTSCANSTCNNPGDCALP